MKKIYSNYYPKSNKDIKNIWDDCIIIPDTNVLLSLYAYPENTRIKVLDILDKLSKDKKIYLLYQIGIEFYNNKNKLIEGQKNNCSNYKRDFIKIKDLFNDNYSRPFLSKDLMTKFKAIESDILNEMETERRKCDNLLRNDTICSRLEKIFDKKVSRKFDEEEIESIYDEGERRYKYKIPPGYEDDGKNENRHGDLLIWKQLIDLAKSEEKSIIFITNDGKKDWWFKNSKDENEMPRPELITEFKSKVKNNKEFYMLSNKNFLKKAEDFLKIAPKDRVAEEIAENLMSFLPFIKYQSNLLTHNLNDEDNINNFRSFCFNDDFEDKEYKIKLWNKYISNNDIKKLFFLKLINNKKKDDE